MNISVRKKKGKNFDTIKLYHTTGRYIMNHGEAIDYIKDGQVLNFIKDELCPQHLYDKFMVKIEGVNRD